MVSMKRTFAASAILVFTTSILLADFSYQETTKVTGGMMMHAGGVAPKPQTSAIYVKGNRLARIGPEHGQITDLDKETIVNVDYTRKTYSIMTFAQMKAMMAQVSGAKDEAGSVNISSHETGKTRVIGNVTAKETIMTVKVGESQIDSDVWLAPMVSGYDEVRQFQQRMAQKMGGAGAAGIQRSMQEAAKALTKANGVPVLQTSSIRGGAPAGAPGGDKPMIETSTEMGGFSAASVDASKFDVPAGFQKTEMGMRGQRPQPAHGAQSPQSRPAHQ